MRWIRRIRYICPWLLAVFVLAQLSCLIPGHYEHADVAAGHAVMHAPSLGSGSSHHAVLGDSGDECCAVHAMPVVPAMTDAVSPGFTEKHRVIAAQQSLAPVRYAPLDPPPKHPSLI